MIVNRSMGDHLTVSTDTTVLPEVADIALNWMDLSLYGNKQAAAALRAPNVCGKCTAGIWKLQAKMLETLEVDDGHTFVKEENERQLYETLLAFLEKHNPADAPAPVPPAEADLSATGG